MKRIVGGMFVFSALLGSGCSSNTATKIVRSEVTVSAASSLTDSFSALTKAFQVANPNLKVRLNFGSSSALVSQIQAGAPSDVMASADLANLQRLVASGNIEVVPRVFASNSMAIAVKLGNPRGVKSITDLTKLGVVSLCGKTVPCGVYAHDVLTRAGVILDESNISRGIDVKATLGAVISGDADAAVVYQTDVIAAKKIITAIEIPAAVNVQVMYGIAPIRGSTNFLFAQAFITFVLSRQGQQILQSFGFQKSS